jgi:GNAT superfamily N-acetyltransferase
MSNISIETQGVLTEDDRHTIIDGLVAYNRQQGFIWEREPLSVVARDARGRIVGGLLGENNLGWLFVSALWVEPENRRSGVGSQLVQAAEDEARRRRCVGVFLDTYSFQARPFYEKLGFRVFGELADCPPGEARYYLYKGVAQSPAPDPGS